MTIHAHDVIAVTAILAREGEMYVGFMVPPHAMIMKRSGRIYQLHTTLYPRSV
jgi:hypothetical protein